MSLLCVWMCPTRVCGVGRGVSSGWVQAECQGVCVSVCLGVMCVPVGVYVWVGAAEGEGSWAASLSSLDRALEKI